MAAPVGNEYWKARSKHGRTPKFKDPVQLLNVCEEYFQWVDDNPLQEEKIFNFAGIIAWTKVSKMRAMTIAGLCTFLDIDRSTWFAWRSREGFSNVITRVEEIIRNQKFTGAAAGLLNANIIARDLGLLIRKTDRRQS
ncbi:MAG: terminase small subunit [Stappiaceae bacterium]